MRISEIKRLEREIWFFAEKHPEVNISCFTDEWHKYNKPLFEHWMRKPQFKKEWKGTGICSVVNYCSQCIREWPGGESCYYIRTKHEHRGLSYAYISGLYTNWRWCEDLKKRSQLARAIRLLPWRI